ncbi:unnamed protein product [Ectocarpus sp. 6 AP-2014]
MFRESCGLSLRWKSNRKIERFPLRLEPSAEVKQTGWHPPFGETPRGVKGHIPVTFNDHPAFCQFLLPTLFWPWLFYGNGCSRSVAPPLPEMMSRLFGRGPLCGTGRRYK